MAKNTGGYKCDFVAGVPAKFDCKKCSLVARELRVTSCCMESFCSSCIENEKGKPCPQCGSASFSTMEIVKYQTEIQNLNVFCSMKLCNWNGPLQLLDSHLDLEHGNCHFVPRIKVDQRMITECKKRPYAHKLCGFRGSFDEVTTNHISKCEHFPIQRPNFRGQTLKRSEMESHRKVCPREIVDCPFSKLGCTEKLKRAEKEEHTEKNHLKHLELAAEAIKNLQEVPQKNNDSQAVKELKKELQDMEKKFKQQSKLIEEQNTRLQKLEKILSGPSQESEKSSKSSATKRPRSKSEPEEGMKSEKRRAVSNTIKSEIPSTPIKSENYKRLTVKGEPKVPGQSRSTAQAHIKSEEKEVEPNVVSTPLYCKPEPKDMKVESPVLYNRYVSEFTLENFSKEKAKDEPNKLETPPMYTHEHGYKFSIGIDANGFDSSRGKAMRVWMKSLPGEYDNQLQWPAKVSFQIELIGNKEADNWIVSNAKTWHKPSSASISTQSFSCEYMDDYFFIDHYRLSDYLCKDAIRVKIAPAFVPSKPPHAGP